MAAAWTSLLSNEAITQMVGHEAFARALVAARGGHVHDVELDEQNLVVSGRVKGTYRDDYAVRVYLASSRSGTVTAYRSQCTCPVVVDCKHAAAVLIVARHLAAAPGRRAAGLGEDPGQAGRRTAARGGGDRPLGLRVRGRADPGVPRLRRPAGPADPARPAGQGRQLGAQRDRLGRPGLRRPVLRPRAPRAVAAVPGGGRVERPLHPAAQRLAVPQHGGQRLLGTARPGGRRPAWR